MELPLIRPAAPEDFPQLLAIEKISFATPHWTETMLRQHPCEVAELDGRVAGFLVWYLLFKGDEQTAPEIEILNVAVTPEYRRRSVASGLLSRQMEREATFFLEVRESNTAAQALYRKFGFHEVGRRSNYYSYPVESAIVMKMKNW